MTIHEHPELKLLDYPYKMSTAPLTQLRVSTWLEAAVENLYAIQRGETKTAGKIAEHPDAGLMEPLKVFTGLDGFLYVFDGFQKLQGLRKRLAALGIPEDGLRVNVLHYGKLIPERVIELYTGINKFRTSPSALDLYVAFWKGATAAGQKVEESEYLHVEDILNSEGFTIVGNKPEGGGEHISIQAVSQLLMAYRQASPDDLKYTANMIRTHWSEYLTSVPGRNTPPALEGAVWYAVALVVREHNRKPGRLEQAMKAHSPIYYTDFAATLSKRQKGSPEFAQRIAECIAAECNKGLSPEKPHFIAFPWKVRYDFRKDGNPNVGERLAA